MLQYEDMGTYVAMYIYTVAWKADCMWYGEE